MEACQLKEAREGSDSALPSREAYFGGKSRVADLVWQRLGDVDNYVECFAGSAAVLLARPHPARIETLNDLNCMVSNFWRSTKYDSEGVAEWCDWPVNEADLHAVHRWLVLGEHAAEFRHKMRMDPDYYDVKVAGRYVWGSCAWIGSGWADDPEEKNLSAPAGGSGERGPATPSGIQGVNARTGHTNGPPGGSGSRSPLLGGGEGQYGHGIHARRPRAPSEMLDSVAGMPGVHANHRPQLADAYSRGRGVGDDNHLTEKQPYIAGTGGGNGVASEASEFGTCAARRAWLLAWFGRLRDRLRTVRVCCGDWLRVCDSESVTTRLGVTGIFMDAPYRARLADGTASRDAKIYSTDDATGDTVDRVIAYCLERGNHPKMRIAACCYEGEGYEVLEAEGWECMAWAASGGYGNRSAKGKKNAKRERIYFSPNCLKAEQPCLF